MLECCGNSCLKYKWLGQFSYLYFKRCSFLPPIQYELVAESLLRRDKLREANQNSLTFPHWCAWKDWIGTGYGKNSVSGREFCNHPIKQYKHFSKNRQFYLWQNRTYQYRTVMPRGSPSMRTLTGVLPQDKRNKRPHPAVQGILLRREAHRARKERHQDNKCLQHPNCTPDVLSVGETI